jgi:hypothetical protein
MPVTAWCLEGEWRAETVIRRVQPPDSARRIVDQGRSSPGSRSLPFFDRSGSVHAERLKQQGRLFPLFIFEMLTSSSSSRLTLYSESSLTPGYDQLWQSALPYNARYTGDQYSVAQGEKRQ